MVRQPKKSVVEPSTEGAETDITDTQARVRARGQGQRMSAKQRQAAQAAFLASYAQGYSVTKSCEAACIHRDTLYTWKEHDEPFLFRFNQAKEQGDDCVRDEIRRRGVEGWDEEVYQLKEYVGTVRKYSDRMLEMMAKARMPEYRDKVQVEQHGSVSVRHEFSDDPEAAALARELIRHISTSG